MTNSIRTQDHKKHETRDQTGETNGFVVPIYNVLEGFFQPGREPQQVYLTTVKSGHTKGPHLHYIRTGFFTCIKGNIRVVVKVDGEYHEYYSGEDHQYCSIEIPTGVPALIINIGSEEALLLNMPNPAWTPEMNDENTADFSDYLRDKHLQKQTDLLESQTKKKY